MPTHFNEDEAPVIAEINLTVGADRGAVGCAADLGDNFLFAVGSDARERSALQLDDEHAAVAEGDRSLRCSETCGDFSNLSHDAAFLSGQ